MVACVSTFWSGYCALGAGKTESRIQLQQFRPNLGLHQPLIHTGAVEEFGIWMGAQYGPQWPRWMPERTVNDHRRVFIMRRAIGLN